MPRKQTILTVIVNGQRYKLHPEKDCKFSISMPHIPRGRHFTPDQVKNFFNNKITEILKKNEKNEENGKGTHLSH